MNGDKSKLIITSNKTMPNDFWNYLVNPIVGFYVGRSTDSNNTKK